MKITKHKRARKLLRKYTTHFAFREPFRAILDGTFCQAALETRTNLREQIPEYLGVPVSLLSTKCVLTELEGLGEDFRGAKLVAKRCEMKKCGHYDSAFSADACIRSLIGTKNRNNYIVATQDSDLKAQLRKIPGVPLLSLNHGQLVLEKPSKATMERIASLNRSKVLPTSSKPPDESALHTGSTDFKKKGPRVKKRKAKGPNPLSVRKKSKTAAH